MKGRPLRGGDRVPILRLPTWPFGRWPRRLPSTAPDFASEPGLASWACRLPVVSCAKGAWVPAGRWRVRGIVHRSSGPWPVIAGARPRKSIALQGRPVRRPRSRIGARPRPGLRASMKGRPSARDRVPIWPCDLGSARWTVIGSVTVRMAAHSGALYSSLSPRRCRLARRRRIGRLRQVPAAMSTSAPGRRRTRPGRRWRDARASPTATGGCRSCIGSGSPPARSSVTCRPAAGPAGRSVPAVPERYRFRIFGQGTGSRRRFRARRARAARR